MSRFILGFATGLFAVVFLFCNSPAAIAHQDYTAGAVTAMVHLEPNDSPQAGKPTSTWFHLMGAHEQTIRLADCTCNLTVYDSQKQAIANPALSETTVAGHEPSAQCLYYLSQRRRLSDGADWAIQIQSI